MSTPNLEVVRLLNAAREHTGSDYRTAQVLGVPQQHVSEWRSGKRTCVPADRARIAGLAHEDAVQQLVLATLDATEGTKRGEQLRALMGKASRHFGEAAAIVAVLVGSLTFLPTPAQARTAVRLLDTMLRKVKYEPT